MKYSIYISYLMLAALAIAPQSAEARPGKTLDFKIDGGGVVQVDVNYATSDGGYAAYDCLAKISASNLAFPRERLANIARIDIANAKFYTKGNGVYVNKQTFGKKYVVTMRVNDSYSCDVAALAQSLGAVDKKAEYDRRRARENMDPKERQIADLQDRINELKGNGPGRNPAGGVATGNKPDGESPVGAPTQDRLNATQSESAMLEQHAATMEKEAEANEQKAVQNNDPVARIAAVQLRKSAVELRQGEAQRQLDEAKANAESAKKEWDDARGDPAVKPEVRIAKLNTYLQANDALARANFFLSKAHMRDNDGKVEPITPTKPGQVEESLAAANAVGATDVDALDQLADPSVKDVVKVAKAIDASTDERVKANGRRELAAKVTTALTSAVTAHDQTRVNRLVAFANGRSDLTVTEITGKDTSLVKGGVTVAAKAEDATSPEAIAEIKPAIIPKLETKRLSQSEFPSSGGEDEAFDHWALSEKNHSIEAYPKVQKPTLPNSAQVKQSIEAKARRPDFSADRYDTALIAAQKAQNSAYDGYVTAKNAMDNEDDVGTDATKRYASGKWYKINGYEDSALAYFRAKVEVSKAKLEHEMALGGRDREGERTQAVTEYDAAVATLNTNIKNVNDARKKRFQYQSYFQNNGWATIDRKFRWLQGYSRPEAASKYETDANAMVTPLSEEPQAITIDDSR